MLQQFLITIFDKLDRGNSWDDDFELNNMLEESIRNSADKMLLTAPDSLVVSLAKHDTHNGEESASTSKKGRALGFGIDALDMLNFTYKVMGFLLKVKRAKFVLDETCKRMWKGRGRTAHNFKAKLGGYHRKSTHIGKYHQPNFKQHLIVEQKLLHFVDAFHHSMSWTEYIIAHGLSFVMAWHPLLHWTKSWKFMRHISLLFNDNALWPLISCKWALLASQVKTILRLALNFHNVEQTLSTGGTAAAVRTTCAMEVDRIEKQFDECVIFLLRILSFKLNVSHFPHLTDLVTRINYNHYFMSDNGSFSSIPGSRPR